MLLLLKKLKKNEGMTYVELIVVLSIISVMSSIVVYNYGGFQAQIDIKILASDIALKVVEAQKASLSGKFPPVAQSTYTSSDPTWKPSYGVFIDRVADNKSFTFFTDFKNPSQNGLYEASTCPGTGECLEKITITKGNTISSMNVFYSGTPTTPNPINNLTVTFMRPNSGAIIKSNPPLASSIYYVEINILSPKGATAKIKLYPSGRVQVN